MHRLLFFIWTTVALFFVIPISAENISVDCQTDIECQQKQTEYTNKLNELNKAKNTLAKQVGIINSQIQLTILKITQTQNSIKTIKSEISDLTLKINDLDVSLNKLSSVYIQQVTQNYKMSKRLPQIAIFTDVSFNHILEQYKYLSTIQKNSQDVLISMETIRTNYDLQKEEKTRKQQELQDLQTKLASQQTNLDKQKLSKDALMAVYKNDEKKYQQLLIAVQTKLASFNNTNAGCLASSPGSGSDGNYYSQIDPRWCKQFIGFQTVYTIGGAGCYLTSMSIILKKIGTNIDPSTYASDPSRFSSTADLVDPPVPSGYIYRKITGYNQNIIDNELKNGRYVIAQVPMPASVSGSHFVVLISGSGGNYKMHDPWRGADLDFNNFYSIGRIISLRLITK